MLKDIFERNKGSTYDPTNPLGLAKANPKRPNKSKRDPGRIEIDNDERPTCRQQWNKFLEWVVETTLAYAKVMWLLVLVFGLIQVKQILADTSELQKPLSILTVFTSGWLIVECIEAHTGFPIREYMKRFLDNRFL